MRDPSPKLYRPSPFTFICCAVRPCSLGAGLSENWRDLESWEQRAAFSVSKERNTPQGVFLLRFRGVIDRFR